MGDRKLRHLDGLFGGETPVNQTEQVVTIDDSLIDEFPGHPYKLYSGKRHADLLESVKELGVITPIILRAEENGRYTLLAGYNRRNCNQISGNIKIPAVIKRDISDGEAKLIITHSNRQRGLDELLPSEKAFAFKMEMDGLKETRRQLKKLEAIAEIEKAAEADGQEVCGNLFKFEQIQFSRETLSEHYELKPTEVHRLIRLTHLCPELLEFVDENQIQIYVAVPLTYLSLDMQVVVHRLILEKGYKVDIGKADLLKAKFREGKLNAALVDEILSGKECQSKTSVKAKSIQIKPTIIKKYFVKGESAKEIQNAIAEALEFYFAANTRMGDDRSVMK